MRGGERAGERERPGGGRAQAGPQPLPRRTVPTHPLRCLHHNRLSAARSVPQQQRHTPPSHPAGAAACLRACASQLGPKTTKTARAVGRRRRQSRRACNRIGENSSVFAPPQNGQGARRRGRLARSAGKRGWTGCSLGAQPRCALIARPPDAAAWHRRRRPATRRAAAASGARVLCVRFAPWPSAAAAGAAAAGDGPPPGRPAPPAGRRRCLLLLPPHRPPLADRWPPLSPRRAPPVFTRSPSAAPPLLLLLLFSSPHSRASR